MGVECDEGYISSLGAIVDTAWSVTFRMQADAVVLRRGKSLG